MTPLEVALTVFVWGAIVSGMLLTVFVCGYLNVLTERTKREAHGAAPLRAVPPRQ